MERKLFLLILFTLLFSCKRKSPTPPENEQYDPRNISRTETDSYGPSIAVAPDGTVYIAWMDGGYGEFEPSHIYFRYKLGEEWSDIEILSDTTIDSWSPHLVVDPFGNVHIVWEEHDPDLPHSKIYYRVRSPSGEWSDIEVLSGEGALQPRIAVDPSGTVHVVWIQGFGMKYKQRESGGVWSAVEAVPVGSTGSENPYICSDNEGGIHIVYEGGEEDIKYLYRALVNNFV